MEKKIKNIYSQYYIQYVKWWYIYFNIILIFLQNGLEIVGKFYFFNFPHHLMKFNFFLNIKKTVYKNTSSVFVDVGEEKDIPEINKGKVQHLLITKPFYKDIFVLHATVVEY